MFDDDDFSMGCDDTFSDDFSTGCTDCFDTNSLDAECMWHDPMGVFSTDNDD